MKSKHDKQSVMSVGKGKELRRKARIVTVDTSTYAQHRLSFYYGSCVYASTLILSQKVKNSITTSLSRAWVLMVRVLLAIERASLK